MRLLPPGRHGTATLSCGDRIDCGSMTVTAGMIDTFADMAGDRFEIHMSDEAARHHGFDARVAHGLLVLSLIDGLKNRA
ncbi:MAG: MaoC/PaaZ C-terminal domain-containing protein, partial [Boseongicola sp.]|nr:MaoC/PaaZ C-terminal domain-containing protein [Boseongicola sp.]